MSKKSNDRFGIVKYKVLSDPSLSIQSKGLYSLIACYVDKNREAYPSASTLADSPGIASKIAGLLTPPDTGTLKDKG